MKLAFKKMVLVLVLTITQLFVFTNFAADCFSEDDIAEMEESASDLIKSNAGCLSADEADALIENQSPKLSKKHRLKVIAENRVHLSPRGPFRGLPNTPGPIPAASHAWVSDPKLAAPRQIMSRRARAQLKESQHRQKIQFLHTQQAQVELFEQQAALTKFLRLAHKKQNKKKQTDLVSVLKKGGTLTPEGELSARAYSIIAALARNSLAPSPVIKVINPEAKESSPPM